MVEAYISNQGFILTGHAEYADKGYDIVCAAISALSQTIAISAELNGRGKAYNTSKWVSFEVDSPSDIQVALFRTLEIGLRHIAKDYPMHLQVKTNFRRRD